MCEQWALVKILMEVNTDGFVMTNPLAGTRPRGANSQEDAWLYIGVY